MESQSYEKLLGLMTVALKKRQTAELKYLWEVTWMAMFSESAHVRCFRDKVRERRLKRL